MTNSMTGRDRKAEAGAPKLQHEKSEKPNTLMNHMIKFTSSIEKVLREKRALLERREEEIFGYRSWVATEKCSEARVLFTDAETDCHQAIRNGRLPRPSKTTVSPNSGAAGLAETPCQKKAKKRK